MLPFRRQCSEQTASRVALWTATPAIHLSQTYQRIQWLMMEYSGSLVIPFLVITYREI